MVLLIRSAVSNWLGWSRRVVRCVGVVVVGSRRTGGRVRGAGSLVAVGILGTWIWIVGLRLLLSTRVVIGLRLGGRVGEGAGVRLLAYSSDVC